MATRRISGVRNLSELRRVLVVDDNHDSAELLALLLGREGHEVRVAHGPREAIAVALDFCPHVAFLDIGLPDMDGFELLRVLQKTPELRSCHFVAVTGFDDVACSAGEGSQGFDAYLGKPVNLDAVVQLVRELGRGGAPAVKPVTA